MRTLVSHCLITRLTLIRIGLATVALIGSSFAANAQDWPTKNVSIIVPYAAGGIADQLARLSGKVLSEKFGKPFVVENRVGGGGIVAANAVSNAAPDGYTLMLSPPGPIVTVPYMRKVNYDPDRFVPITIIAHFPLLFAVKASIPVKSFPELLAYAKANPGKLNYASGGVGSVTHLATALLAKRAGLDIVHVPYKGSAPATTALIAGEIDMFFGTPSELLPQLASGKIKIIATWVQSACPRFLTFPRSARPSGLPAQCLEWTLRRPGNAAVSRRQDRQTVIGAVRTPEIVERLKALGVFPGGVTPEQFAKIIAEDKVFYKGTYGKRLA